MVQARDGTVLKKTGARATTSGKGKQESEVDIMPLSKNSEPELRHPITAYPNRRLLTSTSSVSKGRLGVLADIAWQVSTQANGDMNDVKEEPKS